MKLFDIVIKYNLVVNLKISQPDFLSNPGLKLICI
jgi:hypothetical protein